MGLEFQTGKVTIPQTNGPLTTNEEVSFENNVRSAEVALKLIKLDYVGGPRDGDITQAGVSLERIGGKTVEFKVKVNYSAATYTGAVHVLVIAETGPPNT
jgi:hypothetical protein